MKIIEIKSLIEITCPCPKCGGDVYFDGECFRCFNCGWWDYNIQEE